MTQPIQILPLKVPGYLITARDGYVLIDCGDVSDRPVLEKELALAGVRPGKLKLVLLTHGDFDHTGNAAFLQQKYGAKIAMHAQDAGMVTHATMGWGRKAQSDRVTLFGRLIMVIARLFVSKDSFEAFTPDVFVEDGQDLSEYGVDARVIGLPGHSRGSIGLLTAGGELFCGDLLMNMFRPELHFLIDDLADCSASVEKLRALPIGTVYPGHGKPFQLQQFLKGYR
jgi:glyoxylase-like metal-dependent hydrolase (beta-lactamase superfamily II)